MRFVITGGGTGGHFYPLIAVVEEIRSITKEKGLLDPDIYYLADSPYDEKLLYEYDVEFRHSPSGKLRRYFSLRNISDILKTLVGIPKAIVQLYKLYPDVVFSKGSYASVPTVIAAWILRLPIIIHESDAIPGRANMLAARFATRIAISWPESAEYLSAYKDKIALVGNPIRREIQHAAEEGAHEFLSLNKEIPTVLFLGGSQGATRLNDIILTALPDLLVYFQVIHQTGKAHIHEIEELAKVALVNSQNQDRYRAFGYLNALAMKMAAGAAHIIVARAGSNTISEIAAWKKPAILVPIPEDVSRDQRTNAYSYARTGGAVVIEEANLKPHVLVAELKRLMENAETLEAMRKAAAAFKRTDGARIIAEEMLRIGLSHES